MNPTQLGKVGNKNTDTLTLPRIRIIFKFSRVTGRIMITYKGIAWPTNINQDLVARVRESATTLSTPVAVATEIYELGTNFRSGLLKVIRESQHSIGRYLLDVAEAAGYARVGHEVLYVNRPIGSYVPIQEFWAVNAEEPEMSLIMQNYYYEDLIEFFRKMQSQESIKFQVAETIENIENQRTAIEVDERLRDEQLVQLKLGLLRQGGYRAVLADLQREAEEERNKRDIPWPDPKYKDVWGLLNLMGHAVRGIRAGIQRYEQLYQACASP